MDNNSLKIAEYLSILYILLPLYLIPMSNKGFLSGYKLILVVVAIVVIGGLVVFSALSPSGQLISYPSSSGAKYTTVSPTVQKLPQPADAAVPKVSVAVNPQNPEVGDAIAVTATGSDDVKVSQLGVSLGDKSDGTADQTKTCYPNVKSGATCTISITYNAVGSHYFNASIIDGVKNLVRDPADGSKYKFDVGPDKTAPKVTVVSSVVKGNPNAWNNGIWVNTSATDAVGLKTITSYFRFFGNNTATQKVCNLNGAKSSRCDFFITSNAPLVGGTQHYWGEAVDTTGNTGRDPVNGETSIDWP